MGSGVWRARDWGLSEGGCGQCVGGRGMWRGWVLPELAKMGPCLRREMQGPSKV